jgi:ribosome-associated toxin RatA of RatAB toxin-antitoxin module
MEASLRIGFKVFTEAYTSRVIMKRPEKIVIKSIESPTFKRIERYAIRGWPGVPGTEC